MKQLNFSFSTNLTFDNYVHDHSFALRCVPIESPTQHIRSFEMNITPFVPTRTTMDAFGNNVVSGYISKQHRFLDFEVNGMAEIDISAPKTDYMPCYLYQSEYTKPDDALREFYKGTAEYCKESYPPARAKYFCDVIAGIISYEKGVTDTKTTAAEAFALKKGVCQDFSHIMLSILRMDKIACRYMSGLACCDGETHSWIEVWDGAKWVGLDPANDRYTDEDYLTLSQGRDFSDCSIDRGVMLGAFTRQMQLITSRLTAVF